MAIEIRPAGKTFVLKHFNDLKKLEKAFETVKGLKESFSRVDIANSLVGYNEQQINIVVDLLVTSHDEEAYDLLQAVPLICTDYGFIRSLRYDDLVQEIIVCLEVKPFPFKNASVLRL